MTDLICRKSMERCKTPGMCAPHGGCQPEMGFDDKHLDLGQFVDWVWNLKQERDQLKAESEALRKDAERYRWLKDRQTFIWLIQDWTHGRSEFTDTNGEIDMLMLESYKE